MSVNFWYSVKAVGLVVVGVSMSVSADLELLAPRKDLLFLIDG